MPTEETHFTNKDRETLIEVKTKLDRAITDISNLGSNYAEKTEHTALVKRVEGLENNITWVVRLVISIIIVALVGTIIVVKK